MFTQQPEGRRARARASKLERIVEVSSRLVAKGGLEALTIHRLAEELDCAAGGLYRYFPSMDELHAELQCRIIRAFQASLGAILDALPARSAGLEALVLAARHYRRYFLRRPGELALLSLGLADPRYLYSDQANARVNAEIGAVLGRLVGAFDAAAAAGHLVPGPGWARALAYFAGVQGVLSLRKMDRVAESLGLPDHQALLEELSSAMLLGWGADPRVLSRVQARARARLGEA